jgi:hypothetical protein
MKLGKLVKTVLKLAPIVYPVVRKMMAEKKGSSARIPRK